MGINMDEARPYLRWHGSHFAGCPFCVLSGARLGDTMLVRILVQAHTYIVCDDGNSRVRDLLRSSTTPAETPEASSAARGNRTIV